MILAFDIGIKNLAFCVLRGNQVELLENVNLLPEVEPIRCTSCTNKASFQALHLPYCKRHLPATHPILPELKGKTLPTHAVLKQLVKARSIAVQGTTKEAHKEALAQHVALPLIQPKSVSAAHVSLEQIHDALRALVSRQWPAFSECTEVLLENQPAFKNPHMKSVQVLLFATLREQFLLHQRTPQYRFVHAKKKVQDAEKGDAGYQERKDKSEARLVHLFESGTIQGAAAYAHWKKASKKSDMADALCMAVDAMKASC